MALCCCKPDRHDAQCCENDLGCGLCTLFALMCLMLAFAAVTLPSTKGIMMSAMHVQLSVAGIALITASASLQPQ